MRRFVLMLILCFVVPAASSTAFAGAEAPTQLAINPSVLNLDTFFSGGSLTVTGEVRATDDVVVEIIGSASSSMFDLKGRIGPFWMTRDKVDLKNAPILYLLLLPSGGKWHEKAAALNMGIDQLRRQIQVSRTETSPEEIFGMFVKLKRSEKLYQEVTGAVSYLKGEDGRKRFSATCRVPSSTKEGKYIFRATAIGKGTLVGQQSVELKAQEKGLVKLVNDMAFNRGLLYGIAAVVIALLAGALMGLIFKGGGGH